MMTSRSTSGSLGHALDKYWKMFICYRRSLSGLQIVKGNPHSRKMLSLASLVMSQKRKYVKQLMQVQQSWLPSLDSVVSSALASTASGWSWAMFESLSSSEEMPCYGSNINGRITPSDLTSNSSNKSLSFTISQLASAAIFYCLTNVMS